MISPISYELMADDTIAFIEHVVGGPAHLVGASAGAAVALTVALRRPDLVGRLGLVSGVFHRDGWVPAAIDPELEPHAAIVAGYAELSPDGREHFRVVLEKLRRADQVGPSFAVADDPPGDPPAPHRIMANPCGGFARIRQACRSRPR